LWWAVRDTPQAGLRVSEEGHAEKSARAVAFLELHEMSLREAITSVRAFQRLEDRGYVDTLCDRYSKLRKSSASS